MGWGWGGKWGWVVGPPEIGILDFDKDGVVVRKRRGAAIWAGTVTRRERVVTRRERVGQGGKGWDKAGMEGGLDRKHLVRR